LAKALTAYDSGIAFNRRWIAHIDNRLAYERAMLSEAGGTAADRFDIEPGGRVKLRGEWASVLRVNRSGGAITSVTTNARYGRVRGIDEVSDYQPPEAGEAEAVAAATKLGPLCNYSSESFISMSKAQWTKIPKDYKGFRKVAATTEAGPHRIRYAMGVFAARDAGAKIDDSKRHSYLPVYVTDEAQKAPPKPATIAAPPIPRPEPIARPVAPKPAESPKESPIASDVDAMRASLKAGVKVATVNQLFPTPSEIAAQMVEAAGIESGMRVLEPSAGTGVLARAADKAGANVTCVEIDQSLFRALAREFDRSFHVDFLVSNPAWFAAPFDRVIMNPPFANGDDIKHIRHAATMLRPGGRLVALCANGPRQQAELKPLASEWRDLPAGSFKAEGTGVNVAMLTIDA
jgi:phospholipid N-methyltransferase